MTVCVVHLVRKAYGPEPFRAFMSSYKQHPAGVAHDLVLILKGFGPEDWLDGYAAIGGGLVAGTLHMPDTGFDLDAYWRAAEELDYERLCFMNSFARIQSDEWLVKMDRRIADDRIGLVGASGSYTSHSSILRWELGLGGPYGRAFDNQPEVRREAMRLARDQGHDVRDRHPLIHRIAALRRVPGTAGQFRAFPNHHVRTNAFLLSRAVMQTVSIGEVRGKMDTWRIESGKASLTRQIERMNLRPVVVGADGHAYEQDEWPRSNTFWQGDQSNLLVADNQTDHYLHGDVVRRLFLSQMAWGGQAAPSPGPAVNN